MQEVEPIDEYMPEGHDAHVLAPVPPWYFPPVHEEHAVLPVNAVAEPARQGKQALDEIDD